MLEMSATARRSKKRPSSNLASINYQLYGIAHVLRIKPFPAADQTDYVQIDRNSPCFYDSCFQETTDHQLLVLHCSNGTLLMRLTTHSHPPVIKQFEWFQNPAKRIQCFCIDPVHASWVIIATADMALYMLPALAQLKHDSKISNACSSWSMTDLTKMEPTKQTGKTSSLVWWHTFDDRNICIIGTEHGEIFFVDLAMHTEIRNIQIREKISNLELMQDLIEHTTHLMIHTAADTTWQLLLEWPSTTGNFVSPVSYTSAFDMGYDMVAECSMDTILAYENEEQKEEGQPFKIKMPAQDFRLSVQKFKDQVFIARHNKKSQTLEVFSDVERAPEYNYQLPPNTRNAILSDNLIFALNWREKQPSLSIVSKQFAAAVSGCQSLKKIEPGSYKADLQTFSLALYEPVLAFYVSTFARPKEWKKLFPHNAGLEEEACLPVCIIVTEGGVMECRPRKSPENYFTELCLSSEVAAAEALGITLDMNVQKLCEIVADKLLQDGDVGGATKFYNLSECCPIRRANNLIKYASVTDGLIFIRQILKHPTNVSFKDKKLLANMAVACYTEQLLEKQKSLNFQRTIAEYFMSFLRDNFDYDPNAAMVLLAKHGMIENLFEVAKTKGKIQEALELCASRGLYYLSHSIQNMLLDRGYADAVCKANNGAFISHLQPEEAVKFLLMQPEITTSYICQLDSMISKLDENSLLQITRLFDPSRSFVKPYLEKAERLIKNRSPSLVSLTSMSSSESIKDDTDTASLSEIFEFFLKTLIIINSKRPALTKIPDRKSVLRYIVGQHSFSSIRRGRTLSTKSIEFDADIEPTTLACGRNHIAFVSRSGDVYTWGRSSHGRLGHGDTIEEKGLSVPFRVEGLHMHGIQVISVACGAAHTVALCREGIYSWGFNNLGQLGVGDTRRRSRPCLISQLTPKNIKSVACGQYHTLAIASDHSVWSWGWGIHGQLGIKSAENSKIPVNISILNDQQIIQVAAGYAHSAVLTVKGFIFTFGAGLYGQLGIGVNTKVTSPKLVRNLVDESVYYIACGPFETLAVSEDQTIYSWGRNYKQFHICAKAESTSSGRQIASNVGVDLSHKYYPEELPFRLAEPISQILIGNWHYAALTTVGQLYTWGCNDCGQLGHYNKIDQNTPRPVKALSRRFITAVGIGSEFTVCVDVEDQVFVWGRADGGQLGIDGTNCKECGPTSTKKSSMSILSPTAIPGLPLVSQEPGGIGSISNKRDVSFDKDTEFPDFSSIGRGAAPYSVESVLVALQKLDGSYDPEAILSFSINLEQFYAASFISELQHRWDKSFKYGLMALQNISSKTGSSDYMKSAINTMVENILSSLEDLLSDEMDIEDDLAALVSFIYELFEAWHMLSLPFSDLEDCLSKRLSFLAPVLAMVLFRHLYDNRSLSIPVQLVHTARTLSSDVSKKLSSQFYNKLTAYSLDQIYLGSKSYSFLSNDKRESAENVADSKQPEINGDVPSQNFDTILKQLLENKLKFHKHRSCIFISSVTAATVSAASSAVRGITPWKQSMEDNGSLKIEPDTVVFTCNHNYPRYYVIDVILPEFKQRMSGLPQPLPQTSELLVQYYLQTRSLIPAACPCCVYNNLRQEQFHLMQEAGGEMSGNKSTFWEV